MVEESFCSHPHPGLWLLMTRALAETITLRLPRFAMEALPSLSDDLSRRMHHLLERNTDNALSSVEHAELETLVQMAQFAELLATAAQLASSP